MNRVIATLEARFWVKVDQKSAGECWPWIGAKTASGYGHIVIGGTAKSRLISAPRLSLMLALKCEDPGPTVYCLHACDNPACVNPAHLRWGTPSENSVDMFSKGRADRSGPRAKRDYHSAKAALDVEQVRDIILRAVAGQGATSISKDTGIQHHIIADIIRGRSYRYMHGKDGIPTTEAIVRMQRGNRTISDELAAQFIRARLAGAGTREAAAELGINEAVAADIASGKSYRHLHGKDGIPSREEIRAAGKRRGHNYGAMHQ